MKWKNVHVDLAFSLKFQNLAKSTWKWMEWDVELVQNFLDQSIT